MEVTEVRIRKLCNDDKMKAVVSITLDNEFVVHDIKIIEGSNGEFVAMPSKKLGDNEYRDIAHPLTAVVREKVCKAIFEEYHRALQEKESETQYEEDLLNGTDHFRRPILKD